MRQDQRTIYIRAAADGGARLPGATARRPVPILSTEGRRSACDAEPRSRRGGEGRP